MNERKSILVVGVGSIGERHLRCFGSTGRAEMSICELNPQLRQAIAERYQVTKVFDNYDEALNARPDAVLICTPAHLHIPMALKAAQAGAQLFLEKPLSTTFEGIAELQAEIAVRKLTAAVAYVYRAHPALTAMREAICSGRFGAPVQIVAVSGQHFPLYRPAYREIYYNNRATGGGAVQDALTHVINAGEWLVGPVDRLVADFSHQVLAGVEVEDTAHVLTRHGAVMGSFSLNQHQAANESTITVICERGTVRFEYHQCRWRWVTEAGGEWHDEVAGPLERDTLFIRQAESFLDAMEAKRAVLCSVEEALKTLRVNLGILKSVERSEWQDVRGGVKS